MKNLADGARTEFSGRRVQNRRRPRSFRLLSRPPRPPKVPNSNCRSPPPVRRSPPYPPLRYRGSRSYSTALTSRAVLTGSIACSDFAMEPYFPTFSRMWPRTRVTYPLSIRSVSSFATWPIWSFQRVRRTVPVSSPTVASTSFRASPKRDVISRSSLNPTTFAKTLTCLDWGVRSFTFVITLSMFSRSADTTALSRKALGKSPYQANSDDVGWMRATGQCYKNLQTQRLRSETDTLRHLAAFDARAQDLEVVWRVRVHETRERRIHRPDVRLLEPHDVAMSIGVNRPHAALSETPLDRSVKSRAVVHSVERFIPACKEGDGSIVSPGSREEETAEVGRVQRRIARCDRDVLATERGEARLPSAERSLVRHPIDDRAHGRGEHPAILGVVRGRSRDRDLLRVLR